MHASHLGHLHLPSRLNRRRAIYIEHSLWISGTTQLFVRKQDSGRVKNIATIVRSLVDRNQKFDIVANVWVRTLKNPVQDIQSERYGWAHGEENIFSDTVFRGVTLMDEHIHSKVNLSVPLATL